MKERNQMYIPCDQRFASLQENDPVIHAWTKPSGYDREREPSTIKRELSPDHLTAIYWG